MNKPADMAPDLDLGLSWRNSFAGLGRDFYTPLSPTPLPSPYWVGRSRALARELGLDDAWLESQAALEAFTGNLKIAGTAPLASVYSGHQFGVWAGQLGDGRAILLGEAAENAIARPDLHQRTAGLEALQQIDLEPLRRQAGIQVRGGLRHEMIVRRVVSSDVGRWVGDEEKTALRALPDVKDELADAAIPVGCGQMPPGGAATEGAWRIRHVVNTLPQVSCSSTARVPLLTAS